MSKSEDPFENLRGQSDRPQPSSADREQAESRLRRAIDAEKLARPPRRRIPGWIAVPVGVGLALSLAFLLRPPTARAVLMETAQAARTASVLAVGTDEYVYTRAVTTDLQIRPGSDFDLDRPTVAYLLRGTREVWRSPADRFVQIRTLIAAPTFFDPSTEAAYRAAGLDRIDGIGQPRTQQFTEASDELIETNWPTDPDDLHEAMEKALASAGNERPPEAQFLDLASDILREANPSSELRAALIEVLAGFDYDIVETAGSIVLSVEYRERLATRAELEITRQGQLRREEVVLLEPDRELGLPAHTIVSSARYSLPIIVGSLE